MQVITSRPRVIEISDSEDDSDSFREIEIPNEMVLNIFERLSFNDLKNAQLVCHQWHHVAQDSTLGSKFLRTFPYQITRSQSWLTSYGYVRDQTRYLIVLDCSNSMGRDFPGVEGRTYWDLAREKVELTVKQLLPIAGKIRLYLFDRHFKKKNIRSLEDLQRVFDKIDDFGDRTLLKPVMKHLIRSRFCKKWENIRVFVFTDGGLNDVGEMGNIHKRIQKKRKHHAYMVDIVRIGPKDTFLHFKNYLANASFLFLPYHFGDLTEELLPRL